MNNSSINHNDIKKIINTFYSIKTIRGIIPALSKKYSEKQIRGIAIESRIEKSHKLSTKKHLK